jgi:hypothetical protein
MCRFLLSPIDGRYRNPAHLIPLNLTVLTVFCEANVGKCKVFCTLWTYMDQWQCSSVSASDEYFRAASHPSHFAPGWSPRYTLQRWLINFRAGEHFGEEKISSTCGEWKHVSSVFQPTPSTVKTEMYRLPMFTEEVTLWSTLLCPVISCLTAKCCPQSSSKTPTLWYLKIWWQWSSRLRLLF